MGISASRSSSCEDSSDGDAKRVLTGHDNGLITINIAEADDVHREKQRTLQKEPYRTLLGHFRHEIGHYFWDRLISERPATRTPSERCSATSEPTTRKRCRGTIARDRRAQWERNFISAYATMHPWEDWAESWAHYLHMVDALETAGAAGLALRPKRAGEPQHAAAAGPAQSDAIATSTP